ncbi:UvrD-helicase domain-containing protein [Ruminococcaceae bacterium OttesenSCG-928-L11]|nr:UvrD-helicase domain-containing protein [Ruminococcaceae bacterium OttesenSCG-928-L11]
MVQYHQLKKQVLERYFQRMNDMQRRAVFQVDGPLLILAGAGSGKTTVLINRIQNMVLFGRAYHSDYVPQGLTDAELAMLAQYAQTGEGDIERIRPLIADYPIRPWNILAITFTNKAAGELKSRLEDVLGTTTALDVHASTFHSLCVRILRRDIESIGYGRNFTIYDTDDSLRVIKEGLRECRIEEKMLPARSVLTAISRAKDSMLSPHDMLGQAGSDFRMQNIAKVYEHYQKTLKAANALDFDDIICHTVRLLESNDEALDYYRNRFRYIMVDEYQDTNNTQYRLISLLAGGHHNLCVVGDDDQSIYKFRGATIENILSFESQFDNAVVIRLEQNYRSTQTILSAANKVIENNTARKGKNLWTSSGDGEKITVVRARDELEESRIIADTILNHVKEGGKFSDNAVLYRMNAQSNTVEKALAKSGMPYRIVGGLRFYERKEIKDMVAYLSVLDNPGDTLRLTRIINEPKRGIGNTTLQTAQDIALNTGDSLLYVIAHADEYAPLSRKAGPLMAFGQMLEELSEHYETHGLADLLDEILEKTGYLRMLETQGFEGIPRIENIMELKSNILKYTQENEDATLSGFLEEIALYTDLDNYDGSADAVVLMTVHSAKGLEFENIFIAGMDEGIFPGKASMMDPAEIEEERRLAYVAITRAKRNLTILSAERRLLFGQTVWGRPSRFASEIPEELVQVIDRVTVQRQKAPALASKTVGSHQSSRSIGISAAAGQPAAGDVSFAAEDRVSHKVFGEGTILSTRAMGGDTLLEIEFDDAGRKKLMANYAKLTKMD